MPVLWRRAVATRGSLVRVMLSMLMLRVLR